MCHSGPRPALGRAQLCQPLGGRHGAARAQTVLGEGAIPCLPCSLTSELAPAARHCVTSGKSLHLSEQLSSGLSVPLWVTKARAPELGPLPSPPPRATIGLLPHPADPVLPLRATMTPTSVLPTGEGPPPSGLDLPLAGTYQRLLTD